MRCCNCKRPIAAGAEAQKMIVEYVQGDGTVKVFGYLMADGPLSAATGQLKAGWHHKCFHIVRKREARGDALTGRVITTGIDVTGAGSGASTEAEQLGERVERIRALAQRIGKPVGDPEVIEALLAEERGRPYQHTHAMPLDTYQLLAHLRYAHDHHGPIEDAKTLHFQFHAVTALADTALARAADAGHREPTERDWRDQHVIDL